LGKYEDGIKKILSLAPEVIWCEPTNLNANNAKMRIRMFAKLAPARQCRLSSSNTLRQLYKFC
jgi:hypothetical protein